MSDPSEPKSRKWKFSLRHLLTLTALVALCIAIGIAHRKNESLNQSRESLLLLSNRLEVTDDNQLTFVTLPKLASDFESWDVHVPEGPAFDLRLGVGDVSETGIPPVSDQVRLSAGRHRVTAKVVVSNDSENQIVVYVDGKQVIQNTPSDDWMPGGWASASGLSWPQRQHSKDQGPVQLSGKRFTPRGNIGKYDYFNGPDDPSVTCPGYRLWIDQIDQTYEPASVFYGFDSVNRFRGVGMRDGLRIVVTSVAPNEITFVRPRSRSREFLLRIIPEFIVDDQTMLSAQVPPFKSWELSAIPDGKEPLRWEKDSQQTVYNAFLRATCKPNTGIKPVIELQWDAARPDDVGIRMAKTRANERIAKLRLRIVGGEKHLWRNMDAGEHVIDLTSNSEQKEADASGTTITLDGFDAGESDIKFSWQTDQSLPLQIVQRNRRGKPNLYGGLPLYRGLPVKFAAEIPKSLAPSVSMTRVDQHPTIPDTPFPGGSVFGEIQIEVKADQEGWLWLKAQDLKN